MIIPVVMTTRQPRSVRLRPTRSATPPSSMEPKPMPINSMESTNPKAARSMPHSRAMPARSGPRRGRRCVARMRPLLGTLVEIRAGGAAARVARGIAAAFAAIERVQRLMSFHEAGSDVSRINSTPVGRDVAVNRETYGVLRYALDLGHRSSGAFDITIAPSLVSAGFLPCPPLGGLLPERADDAIHSARFSDLELLP